MSTHAALLRAICESPADDLPRLALADWLEETGEDAARAEFIRAQVELAGWVSPKNGVATCESKGSPARAGDRSRCQCRPCILMRGERELLKRHGNAWVPRQARHAEYEWRGTTYGRKTRWDGSITVDAGSGAAEATFSRGFVSNIACPMQVWLDHGPAVVLVHPVTDVKLSDREPWFSGGNPDTAKWWGWHCESDDPDGLHPATLPGVLFALLPGGTTHYFDDDGACRRAYPSRQEAMDALSTAAVALARQKAGLPPLPE